MRGPLPPDAKGMPINTINTINTVTRYRSYLGKGPPHLRP